MLIVCRDDGWRGFRRARGLRCRLSTASGGRQPVAAGGPRPFAGLVVVCRDLCPGHVHFLFMSISFCRNRPAVVVHAGLSLRTEAAGGEFSLPRGDLDL